MKIKFLIIFVYIVVTSTYIYLSNTAYNSELNDHLSKKTNDLRIAYEKVVETYSIPAKIIFDLKINKLDILSLLSRTIDADSLRLKKIRDQLYLKLSPDYNKLLRHNYRELHFHLPDNTSFLRFHRREKHGDDLTLMRSTVRNTNKLHKYSQGFEEGAVHSAFRYVFPLQYAGDRLGSVEISVSYLGIISKIEKNKDIACGFMISRESVNKKGLEPGENNYLTCNANKNFYVEKEGYEKIINKLIDGIKYPKIFKEFYEDPKAQGIFNSFDSGTLITTVDGKNFTVTILRILNFDNIPVAYITAVEKDEFKDTLLSKYYLNSGVRLLLILLVLSLLVVTFLKNREIQTAKEKIKVLDGLLPICSYCKKIRDDEGNWDQIESYIDKKSEAKFSHSLCPDCAKDHYSKILKK